MIIIIKCRIQWEVQLVVHIFSGRLEAGYKRKIYWIESHQAKITNTKYIIALIVLSYLLDICVFPHESDLEVCNDCANYKQNACPSTCIPPHIECYESFIIDTVFQRECSKSRASTGEGVNKGKCSCQNFDK